MNFTYTETLRPGSIPIRIDASLLKKAFCQTAFANTLKGLRSNDKKLPLVIGTAVHAYLAKRHDDSLVALSEAIKIYKTVSDDTSLMTGICAAYPDDLLPPPANINGKRGVEYYFEVPWMEVQALETSTPIPSHESMVTYTIILCGTIDHLSFIKDRLLVYDPKSTRKWKLDEVRAMYKNDVQFIFYPWILWKFGYNFLTKPMADAARELRLSSFPVHAFLTTKTPRWIVGEENRFTEEIMEDFTMEVKDLVQKMLTVYLSGDPPNRDGWIKNHCPGCDYNILCHARPEMYEAVKSRLFHIKPYTPKEHGK